MCWILEASDGRVNTAALAGTAPIRYSEVEVVRGGLACFDAAEAFQSGNSVSVSFFVIAARKLVGLTASFNSVVRPLVEQWANKVQVTKPLRDKHRFKPSNLCGETSFCCVRNLVHHMPSPGQCCSGFQGCRGGYFQRYSNIFDRVWINDRNVGNLVAWLGGFSVWVPSARVSDGECKRNARKSMAKVNLRDGFALMVWNESQSHHWIDLAMIRKEG